MTCYISLKFAKVMGICQRLLLKVHPERGPQGIMSPGLVVGDANTS